MKAVSFFKNLTLAPPPSLSAGHSTMFIGGLALCLIIAAVAPKGLAIAPAIFGAAPLFIWVMVKRTCPPLHAGALMVMGGLVALAVISTLWATDPGQTFNRAGKIAAVLLPGALFIGLAHGVKTSRVEQMGRALPFILMAALAFIWADFEAGQPVYRILNGIDAGVPIATYETNRACMALALFCLPVLAVIHRLWPGKNGWGMAAILIFLGYNALNTSDTQSGMLAFIIGVCAFYLPTHIKAVRRMVEGGLLVGIAAAPFIAIALFRYAAGPLEPFVLHSPANPLERLEIWDFVSRYALQNPLTGYGIDAARVIQDFDNAQIYEPAKTIMHPHNGALQIWIEYGVIGAVAAMAGVWALFRRIDHVSPADRRMMIASILAACSIALTGYGLWQGWWLGALVVLAALIQLSLKIPSGAQQPAGKNATVTA